MPEDNNTKLVRFLYELMNSYLPPSKVEFLMAGTSEPDFVGNNVFLQQYAVELANRLTEDKESPDDHEL